MNLPDLCWVLDCYANEMRDTVLTQQSDCIAWTCIFSEIKVVSNNLIVCPVTINAIRYWESFTKASQPCQEDMTNLSIYLQYWWKYLTTRFPKLMLSPEIPWTWKSFLLYISIFENTIHHSSQTIFHKSTS